MSLAQALFALEGLDTEIDRLDAAILDARRRLTRNTELDATEKRLNTLRPQESTASSRQRSLENDIAEIESRIKRDHGRLYSGEVVDSREIGSLERELVHYRARQGELEEQCLTVMDRAETLRTEIERLESLAAELRTAWEAEKVTLNRDGRKMVQDLAAVKVKREEAAAAIDPGTMDMYTRLRKVGGHAVSRVTAGVCGTCRVNLPPKDIQHAWSDTALVNCTNCGRILYVE